jgi:hypothetical protein
VDEPSSRGDGSVHPDVVRLGGQSVDQLGVADHSDESGRAGSEHQRPIVIASALAQPHADVIDRQGGHQDDVRLRHDARPEAAAGGLQHRRHRTGSECVRATVLGPVERPGLVRDHRKENSDGLSSENVE